jgi:transposase InsO family protein
MVVMDVFTRRIIGFGVAAANLDGPVVCRMFNRVIAKQRPPRYLSSDHDPLFRFHRWLANLRVLEVDEIKAIPCTPRSHALVERLIGTVRREYLDRTLFGTKAILSGSSRITRLITTNTGVTAGWPEPRRLNAAAQLLLQLQTFSHIAGGNTATPYFRPQLPHELEFATDRLAWSSESG